MRPVRHLYLHIPFCPKLCPYCSFFVEVGAQHKTQAFLNALVGEMEAATRSLSLQPETIYLGGGTPSALLVPQLDFLLSRLREVVDCSQLLEFTIEANPATLREDKAQLLRERGITRVSLGVQSWDNALLRTLGRVHSAAQAEKTYRILREVGFRSVSMDLIFAVPGQTTGQWGETLEHTIALQPDHVSCYCLTYEEDTEYFRKLTGGTFQQDDERDARLFEDTMERLSAAGFEQYEISNHARPGHASQHNRAYWLGADYLGFGPSAFSTIGCERWENVRDTAEYIRRISAGESAAAFRETLSPAQRAGETMAFRIRMSEGVPRSELIAWAREVADFERNGILEPSGENLRLTRRGRMVADAVGEAFIVTRS